MTIPFGTRVSVPQVSPTGNRAVGVVVDATGIGLQPAEAGRVWVRWSGEIGTTGFTLNQYAISDLVVTPKGHFYMISTAFSGVQHFEYEVDRTRWIAQYPGSEAVEARQVDPDIRAKYETDPDPFKPVLVDNGILTVGALRAMLDNHHPLTQIVINAPDGDWWNIAEVALPADADDHDDHGNPWCAVTLFPGTDVSPIQY